MKKPIEVIKRGTHYDLLIAIAREKLGTKFGWYLNKTELATLINLNIGEVIRIISGTDWPCTVLSGGSIRYKLKDLPDMLDKWEEICRKPYTTHARR